MELAFGNNQAELEKFTIQDQATTLKVQRTYVANQVIFLVSFPDGKSPLVLTRATDHKNSRFWTSIPEGRQKEAEAIGLLIQEFILSNQQ